MHAQLHVRTLTLVVGLALAARPTALVAQNPPDPSPFAAATPAAATGPAAGQGYELVGMTVVEKTTLLGISRMSDHRSVWIPLGGTADEITAVSYDAKADQAVIRVNGHPLTLSMRRAVILPATPPTLPPTPSAPPAAAEVAATDTTPAAPPPAMTAQEEKEMEARMLVTDLLEIGQEQRKAYAARKAAADQAAAAAVEAADAAPAKPTQPLPPPPPAQPAPKK